MLDIIVSQPCAFADIRFEEDSEKLIQQAFDEGHTPVSISYFHGKLEDEVGYDIGVCLNGEEFSKGENDFIEGIYDCSIRNYSGKCKAYLWNSEYMGFRGLIVDVEDTEAVNYAKKKYAEKANHL